MMARRAQFSFIFANTLMIGAFALLAACAPVSPLAKRVSLQVAAQPKLIANCPVEMVATVKFVQHRDLLSLADAYEVACGQVNDGECKENALRLRGNNLNVIAFHVENTDGSAEIHYLPPEDFNDWYRLAQLGHEAFHLCGARHELPPKATVPR